MTAKFKKNGFVAATIALCATATLFSCKKENKSTDTPDGTSTFWEDDYQQNALNGKVKTVIEWNDETEISDECYRKISFDQNGNKIEDANYKNDRISSGLVFKHNAQNRITRCEYYAGNELDELAEFTYGGTYSHNVYIPSNLFPEDLRLQKGITDIVYTDVNKNNQKVISKLESIAVNKDQLTYTFAGGGGMGYIHIMTNGNYPSKIDGENLKREKETFVEVTFNSNGIPAAVYYFAKDNVTIFEYIVKGGFMTLTSETSKTISTGEIQYRYQYTYNEHGYLESEQSSSGKTDYYTYEYDDKGNWTKQFKNDNLNLIREYTYWE